MGSLPHQKVTDLYEQFKSNAITFSKEVIAITGLVPGMVSLKCANEFLPCVVYSSSFDIAKVIISNKSGIIEKYHKSNNSMSIRFHFLLRETGEKIVLLAPVKIASTAPYPGSQDMSMLNLQFTQRTPDDFIEIMGRVQEAVYFSETQREQLFPMTPDAFRKMHLSNKEVIIGIEGANYNCILRNIGFNEAKFIIKDVPKTIVGKQASIQFNFDEPRENVTLEGSITRYELVVDHPELTVVSLVFNEPVSLFYKVRLSSYLASMRIIRQKAPKQSAASDSGAEESDAAYSDIEEKDVPEDSEEEITGQTENEGSK